MRRITLRYPWKSKDFPIPVHEIFIEISLRPFSVRIPIINKTKNVLNRCTACGKHFRWGYVPARCSRLTGLFHFSCLDGLMQEDKNAVL